MVAPYNNSEEKPFTPVEIIPIDQAVLCADCNAITRATNGHCLACGSASIVQLEKLLNRAVVTEGVTGGER